MNRTITIGPLYSGDAPGCAELERMLFPEDDPWSAQMFRDELSIGHHYVAARLGDQLIGYGGLALVGSATAEHPAEAEVHTIGVHPDHQGHGVGRRLLGSLLARADDLRAMVFLEVRTDNAAALGLYRSTGFEQLGVRRNYYQPSGADAFTMCRPVRPGA